MNQHPRTLSDQRLLQELELATLSAQHEDQHGQDAHIYKRQLEEEILRRINK